MATYEHVDIMVCTNCALYVANGDLPSAAWGTERDDARILAGEETLAMLGYRVHCGDSSRDDGFSRDECDMCSDYHHGARHHAIMWREIESENGR